MWLHIQLLLLLVLRPWDHVTLLLGKIKARFSFYYILRGVFRIIFKNSYSILAVNYFRSSVIGGRLASKCVSDTSTSHFTLWMEKSSKSIIEDLLRKKNRCRMIFCYLWIYINDWFCKFFVVALHIFKHWGTLGRKLYMKVVSYMGQQIFPLIWLCSLHWWLHCTSHFISCMEKSSGSMVLLKWSVRDGSETYNFV